MIKVSQGTKIFVGDFQVKHASAAQITLESNEVQKVNIEVPLDRVEYDNDGNMVIIAVNEY